MNSRKNLAALTVILGLTMVISGCAGGSGIKIALGPSGTQNAVAGQVVNISATVTNDSKAAGVTWSLTGPGALSAQTATSVTYTAPSPISANATATITATSVSDTAKMVTLTINLQAVSIGLTPSAAQTDEQSQTTSVTAAVSNDPKTKGVTWSLSGAGALSGQTATAVTYTAPTSITAASTATITATSAFDNTKTTTLTINLVPPPSIVTTTLPSGTVGAVYTTTNLAATGGVAPYTWTLTSAANTFPGGLTISSAGTIAGTPTALGTFNFTAQVKDADGFAASANLSIKVTPAPVVVTTASLPNGVVNSANYSATLAATGGAPPLTWSWASQTGSTLPTGLALNAATGVISGTPTATGTFNVTVTATDSSSPALSGSKNLSLTVIPQLVITSGSVLPSGITNTAYTGVTLASTGGSGAISWSLATGSSLPAGLSLNGGTGAITGTPTTAGNYSFTVQAADSGTPQQKATKSFTLTINQQLVITTPATLHIGSVTTPYSVTLASSGGTGAVTWAVASGSTLPGGLTLTSAGVLAGTPTTANSYNFSIIATDSGAPPQTAAVAFALTITPKLAITTTSLPSGTLGTSYSTTAASNNGGIAPYGWSWAAQAGSSLPPGLSIASGTGIISGTPTATGAFNVTVTVADSSTPTAQTASSNFTISIATAPLSVATTGLPNGVIGQAYTGAVLQSAGGNPPVTWTISVGSLPSWASLNATTGAITGTPTATGTTSFTVKATDSTLPTAQTATKQLSITVVAALSITTASLPNGTVGSSYNTTVAATGGTTPYAWSWSAQGGSSLPPGLSINSSTGAITGTPGGSGGTYNVTVSVADSGSPQQNTSANYSITITVATLSVTTTSGSLPSGTVNSAYPNNVNLSATGGIPPYSWTWVAQAGSQIPPGLSLSSGGLITGTPTTVGTFNVTATVTDSATPTANTANANLSITVSAAPSCTAGGSEALLSGQYAFVLKGFDNGTGAGETAPEPALVGGVITVDGAGHITAGALDMNLNSGVQTNLAVTSASSFYKVTASQTGCMVIVTSAGTQNYRFSVGNVSSGVASTGHMIDFDASGPFTAGILRKQTASAFGTGAGQVTGNYAFGVSSPQNTAFNNNGVLGGNFGAVGVFDMSGGTVTGGEVDFNNSGFLDGSNTAGGNWPAAPGSFTSGSYSIASANGRGTLTFTPSGAGNTAVNTVIYVVSSAEMLVMDMDSQTSTMGGNTVFAGELLKQSGSFTANPLSGTYVGYQSGPSSSVAGASRVTLLLITPTGTSLSGTQLRNDAGSFQEKSISSVTYTVSSTGRMTLSGAGANNPPIFYLVSANEAFLLDSSTTADSGVFQSQSGGPFSTSSATGSYAFGTVDPEDSNGGVSSGVAAFTPATSSINVTQDQNNSGGGGPQSGSQSFTYTVDSTGLGMIPSSGSSCTISATSTTCQTVFYIISPTKAVVMDTQSSNPKAQLADK